MNISLDVGIRRRLQSSVPSWGDFLVVAGLGFILWYLLRIIKAMNDKWKRLMKKRIEKAIKLRDELADNFRKINGYSWDYVIVFKVHQAHENLSAYQKEFSIKVILDRLAAGGLETKLFYSAQNDEVYCKIRTPKERLLKEADRVNYQFLMEASSLGNRLRMGDTQGRWNAVEVPSFSYETNIAPYEYIYIDYDDQAPENNELIKKQANGSIFRGVDRLKLLSSILAAPITQGGCHLDILRLIRKKAIMGFFPLHDIVEIKILEERWLRFFQPPWLQHVDVVKDYFGEKIAFYFLWLGHYTTWLIPAAFIGFIGWIGVAADKNNPNAPIMPYFAAFIAVWSSFFLEYWKRKEKKHAMMWGTFGFEESEQDRPEFKGTPDVSPVDGSPIKYYPPFMRTIKVYQSTVLIGILILLVIGVIAAIFTMRIILSRSNNSELAGTASIIAAIVNAIQIQIFNMLYSYAAISFNDYENHRTDTEYEDALIAKTFIFQFVNSFASLFYIAFVKPFSTIDPCRVSCMVELQTGLGTIFLTRLLTSSLLQITLPYINKKMREKSETKGAKLSDLSHVEREYIMQEYHVILGPFADFADMVIQFAYATMFIAAYPLATVLAFINNYVAMRVGAWKLLQLFRRPEPRSCEDIGTWYYILEIISFAAVIVNSALVAFTSSITINYPWFNRVWIFIGMSCGIMFLKITVAIAVPDLPRDVEIQLERRDYILDKIVRNIPDDLNEFKKSASKTQYNIRLTDDDPL